MASPPANSSNRSAPLDTIFAALADENRRRILRYFWSSSETVATVEDLVAYSLAQYGAQDDPEHITIYFHHATLPMLDDAGLLDYDARSNRVRYLGDPLAERVLGLVTEIEDGGSVNG